jgi:hypothetical protein
MQHKFGIQGLLGQMEFTRGQDPWGGATLRALGRRLDCLIFVRCSRRFWLIVIREFKRFSFLEINRVLHRNRNCRKFLAL